MTSAAVHGPTPASPMRRASSASEGRPSSSASERAGEGTQGDAGDLDGRRERDDEPAQGGERRGEAHLLKEEDARERLVERLEAGRLHAVERARHLRDAGVPPRAGVEGGEVHLHTERPRDAAPPRRGIAGVPVQLDLEARRAWTVRHDPRDGAARRLERAQVAPLAEHLDRVRRQSPQDRDREVEAEGRDHRERGAHGGAP